MSEGAAHVTEDPSYSFNCLFERICDQCGDSFVTTCISQTYVVNLSAVCKVIGAPCNTPVFTGSQIRNEVECSSISALSVHSSVKEW